MAQIIEEENPIAIEARKEYEAERDSSEAEPKTEEPAAEPKPEVVEPVKEEAEPEKPAEKTEEAKEVKEEVKSEDEAVNEWALKNGITVEEAKEDLEKTKAVIEKYKTPQEIAKALRSTQSAYDKLRAEATKEKEAVPFTPSQNPKLEVSMFVDANKDKLVENYRNNYPAKTRDMEDDAILEEVSDKLLSEFSRFQSQQMEVVKNQAAAKREQLFAGLSESDRKFLPDIKAVVDKTADHSLLSKSFNLVDVVRWAKGAKYDEDVKAAEERGFKRAKEEAKIVGIVPSGSASTKVKSSSGSGVVLDEYSKRRAKEMFGTTNMTEDEMYREFANLQKKNKK